MYAYYLLEGCRGIANKVLVCEHHSLGHPCGTTGVAYRDKVFWFRRLKGEDNNVTGHCTLSLMLLSPFLLASLVSTISLSFLLTTRSVGFSFPLTYI